MANKNATQTGSCYWMPAQVPFSGVDGERKVATTKDAEDRIKIVASTTNLVTSFAKVTDLKGTGLWSEETVPVLSMFGKRDSARPWLYFKRHLPLIANARIRAELLNVGSEGAGHLVYLALPQSEESEQPSLANPQDVGENFIIPVDAKFTGTLNEDTSTETNPQEEDLVIWGAITNLNSALVRLTGADGRNWMNDPTPVWAVAGRAASELPILYWPRPYALPRQRTIKFSFKNAASENGGGIYLVAQKLK